MTRLLDRPDGLAVFHRNSCPIDQATFLSHAHTLAAVLPPGQYLINLCQDRYAFAIAFAAGLIAGRAAILNAAPFGLADLAASYPGCTIITDRALPDTPVPVTLVDPDDEPAGPIANPEIDDDHLAAIVFTSGSTGHPVPHAKRWGALVARSRAAVLQFGLEGGTIIGTVPPQHMYGFETTILLPLHAPVSSWCGPAFFPGDIAAALSACAAPRHLVTTPLQLRNLLAARPELPALAGVISATAPLDPALAHAVEAAWSTTVSEIFGATECGSIASRRTVAGPVWAPYPGIQLDMADGLTTVHAPHADPVALADDLEAIPGGFQLLGRRTDVVKLGGRRASLPGLNQALIDVAGVDDGAFVVPDDADEQNNGRLVAVVVAPGRSAHGILNDLRRVLDPVFVPRRIVRVAALPRNDLGKLPREALLQLVTQGG